MNNEIIFTAITSMFWWIEAKIVLIFFITLISMFLWSAFHPEQPYRQTLTCQNCGKSYDDYSWSCFCCKECYNEFANKTPEKNKGKNNDEKYS